MSDPQPVEMKVFTEAMADAGHAFAVEHRTDTGVTRLVFELSDGQVFWLVPTAGQTLQALRVK